MHTALITGATGFLGAHFVLNFVGKEVSSAYVLVRGLSDAERADKLRSALVRADESYLIRHDLDDIFDRITIIRGDISNPMLGINDEDLQIIKNGKPLQIWHFAASLNYEDRRQHDIELANVEGSKNVLELAKILGAAKLYHCSTAYTCGTEQGTIHPEPHDPLGPFNNHYERTKCEAEAYLRIEAESKAPHEHGHSNPKIVVIRPSVVIGNSQTMRPGGASSGLYGFLREFHNIRTMLSNKENSVRMWVSGTATVNLIPVDELMRQLRVIINTDPSTEDYTIAHLVSSGGPTNGEIFDIVRNKLGAWSWQISDHPLADMNGLEKLLDQRTEFYRSYFRSDRNFVPSVAASSRITTSEFAKYVDEALKTLDGRDIGTIFTHTREKASDGSVLNVYSSARQKTRTAILLCNAVGMPIEFLAPLAEKLSKLSPVITWESRALPSGGNEARSIQTDLDRQIQDGIEILSSTGAEAAIIIGWCTGARIALEVASRWHGELTGLALLNGGYNFENCKQTAFEANMANSMPRIAADPKYAEMFFKGIFAREGAASRSSAAASKLLASASAQDIYLASLPFQSAENLFTYARLLSGFFDGGPRINTAYASKTLVLTCNEDLTVSPESSHLVAEMMPGCQFHMVNGGDHFSLYWDKIYIDYAEKFVARALVQSEVIAEAASLGRSS